MENLPVAEILQLATRWGASRVWVFGSRARGDAHEKSDLDLLVELKPGTTLLDLIRMEGVLEELLGISVEVVSKGGIKGSFAESVLREARELGVAA